MAQSTDRSPGMARDVTGDHTSKAALVLAEVAKALVTDNPQDPADSFKFMILVGVRAYDQAGRSCHGGGQNVSRRALAAVADLTGLPRGEAPAGTREEFAVTVAQAAQALGYDWSGTQFPWSQDADEPAIPRHPVPGPRRSDESATIPAPRPEQGAGDR